MRKRKIAVICSSRATYGYKRRIIRLLHESEAAEPLIIVTGMHLLPEYGYSIKEIEADCIPIAAKVDMMIGGHNPASWAKSIGVEIQGLAQVFSMLEPEIVLVTGDRGEMFAAAACAAYMNIPVAHIQSGDRSGHIDGSARHAMTKLSHIHFPACQDSAGRVLKMGEEPWRVHNVGAPQLDEILSTESLLQSELEAMFDFDFNKPVILLIQHPVLCEHNKAYEQMIETMAALEEVGEQTIAIYPNVDAGGMNIINAIKEYETKPFLRARDNLERRVFISLLSFASLLVGNSSSGILEAPSFKLPVLNIGNRQRDRMQACNVVNAEGNRKAIAQGIRYCLEDNAYRANLANCRNPYGDGKSSERIVNVLCSVDIDDRLIDKVMTY